MIFAIQLLVSVLGYIANCMHYARSPMPWLECKSLFTYIATDWHVLVYSTAIDLIKFFSFDDEYWYNKKFI